MKHYCDTWIHDWCAEHGWTDPVMEPLNHYWAFPPGGVMPEPIPSDALRLIKSEQGLSQSEKFWTGTAIAVALLTAGLSYLLECPMPLVAGFAYAAFVAAGLEVDEF